MHATRARYYYYLLLIIKQIIEYFQRARCGSAPLRWKCSARCCARCTLQGVRGPAALLRNSPARRARIHMTRGWAVESGGSTSCEWKEGGMQLVQRS